MSETLIDWWYPESHLYWNETILCGGPDTYCFKAPPVEGAKPVYWLVDEEWIHTGWVMPTLPTFHVA